MLGQLTGYLFGGVEPSPAARDTLNGTAAAAAAPCRALPAEDPELDEWVMVADGASPSGSSRTTPACSTTPSSPTSQLTVEDNWTLTPPACFSTRGHTLPPATSLENLLIEHPSMSVYVRSSREPRTPSPSTSRSSASSPSPTPEPPTSYPADEYVSREEIRRIHLEVMAEMESWRNPPPRPDVTSAQKLHRRAVTQAQKQVSQQRQGQGQRHRSAAQVQRNNQARQVKSAGNGPMRRQHHYTSARHSGANNNRKC